MQVTQHPSPPPAELPQLVVSPSPFAQLGELIKRDVALAKSRCSLNANTSSTRTRRGFPVLVHGMRPSLIRRAKYWRETLSRPATGRHGDRVTARHHLGPLAPTGRTHCNALHGIASANDSPLLDRLRREPVHSGSGATVVRGQAHSHEGRNAVDVSLKNPALILVAKNPWPGTAIVVFGMKPPPSGQLHPVSEQLAVLGNDPSSIQLPTVSEGGQGPSGFEHAALAFAITTQPDQVGTAVVEIYRDADSVDDALARPLYKTIELKRKKTSDPMFAVRTFTLKATP